MKKFFSLLAAVLFAGSMMADSYTITFKESGTDNDSGTGLTSTTVADYVATGAEYVSAVAPSGKVYNARTGRGLKFGNSSNPGAVTLTLATPVNVTSIVVTAMQYKDGEATLKVQDKEDYTTTSEMADYTYTYASATEVSTITVGTATKRGYVKQIVVNYEAGGVTPPEPTAEYYLVGNFNNWQADAAYKFAANPNNAGEYMVDATLALNDSIKVIGVLGETTTWYPDNKPNYVITTAGDYTIYFRPEGGQQGWYEGVFYAEYHAPAAPKTCAEIYSLAKNDEVTMNAVTVTYANGKYVWVKDETGAMLLYLSANTTWAAGDVLTGVAGVVDIYNGLYEVKPSADQVAAVVATPGEAPAPVELTAVVDADVNKYVLLKGVAAEGAFAEGKASNINITLGENTYVLRNNFKNAYTFEAGKTYNVKAVVSYYNALQLYFIDAEEILPNGFYLVGNFNEWTPASAYHFVGNPADPTEFMVSATLAENDQLKVVNVVDNGITAWYPGDGQPNYVVDAAHAGEKTIYFKPDYQEAWAAFGGYFFIEANAFNHELYGSATLPVVDKTWFATTDQWVVETNSHAEIVNDYDINVVLVDPKAGQWQSQVFVNPGFTWEVGAYYKMEFDLATNNQLGGVTVKVNNDDNAVFYYSYPNDNVFLANQTTHFIADSIYAKAEPTDGGQLIFAFGWTAANTEILISNIVITKYDSPVVPVEPINITISSLTNPGQVIYADVIASQGYWDIYAYNDQYEIEISNIFTTEAAGTYTIDDLDADYTYIVPAEGDTVHFTAGQVVLSITDGVVNVAGQLTGDDNNIYNVNLTYADPKAERLANVTISNGTLYDGYAAYGLYAVYGTADDNTAYVQLAIWAEEDFDGDFTEEDLDFQYVGSGVQDADGSHSIFSAVINVLPGEGEGVYSIIADLLCYNNTLYKVSMSIGKTEGYENVDAAVKAIKRLVNGNVVIEKAGKKYTVNGANL